MKIEHHNIFSSWKSRVVQIGGVMLGGNHPIRVQSMTNTRTLDTDATVGQCIRLAGAGCELIRITTQNINEAEHLSVIKKKLKQAGYSIPLIADVHFNPEIAETAARIVEKVRINPGNYVDKRSERKVFATHDYENELEKIALRIQPLLKICKHYGTAIRIGTNHGSLSARIMQRYGDTPMGMAESAMEFARICDAAGFHNLVLSMKSSNVRVMVEATRLLVSKMMAESMNFPVHLGVTEAGNGHEGRIKSAAGISTLLAEGIGDTIRVSLTEAPENEIAVARQIVSNFSGTRKEKKDEHVPDLVIRPEFFNYKRRISKPAGTIGNGYHPVVIMGLDQVHSVDENMRVEGNAGVWRNALQIPASKSQINYLRINPTTSRLEELINSLSPLPENTVLVFETSTVGSTGMIRKIISVLDAARLNLPVLLAYQDDEADLDKCAINAAVQLSPLLNDGLCDGIFLENRNLSDPEINAVAFGILQAIRSRITRNEYIACPGCGRTQYDLEGTLEKVKNATSHLKGLKIAVMGCIVNGPGEMADADFGYVGQGNGKVSIYKGKTLVKKNIPDEEAVRELVALMKAQDHSSQ